jgi:hypothetical protein
MTKAFDLAGPSRRAAGIIGVLASLLGACGDDSGAFKTAGLATLEANDDGISLPVGGSISVAPGNLSVGEQGIVSELRFTNSGNAVLKITSIDVTSDPPGVFALAGGPSGEALGPFPTEISPQDEIEGTRSLYAYLLFTRPASGIIPTGKIRIQSNSVDKTGFQQPVIEFDIKLENSRPTIQVFPTVINLGTVPNGATEQGTLNILNQGNDTLLVNSFILRGHPNFELLIGASQYKVTDESASAGIVLEEPLEIEAGTTTSMAIRYTASDATEARGELVLFSNDPAATAGTTVPIQANVGGPCISVNPRKVTFGGKLVGKTATVDVQVTSCGDQPLELSEIAFLPDSSPEFSLSLANVPGAPAEGPLTQGSAPVTLAPNQTATFQVEYFPEDISPLDAVGQPVYDLGTIRIRSNSFQAELLTEVSAFGVEKECPTAVIIVQEGEEVIPQTRLHLIGSQSYAATGTIQSYRWEVDQPNGSQSVFLPSATIADPTFEVNAAGTYTFRLTVQDSSGEPSCVPAEVEVFVNPDEAIHIELLWNTPNDPDQTDNGPIAGADLDLHFAHPLAVGGFDGDGDGQPDGWFDLPFDTFWYNEQPNWGSIDPAVDDDPSLDRDDTDGAGPENVNLNIPENNTRYKVGVHYWKDHGFGPSFVTVRVFIFGVLVFELTDVELVNHDMWTVTHIEWPPTNGKPPELVKVCSGTTTTCASDAECGGSKCGLRISPNYQHPFYPSE